MNTIVKLTVDDQGNVINIVTDNDPEKQNELSTIKLNKKSNSNNFKDLVKINDGTNKQATHPITDLTINNNFVNDDKKSKNNSQKNNSNKSNFIVYNQQIDKKYKDTDSKNSSNKFPKCAHNQVHHESKKQNFVNRKLMSSDPRWEGPRKNTSVGCESEIISSEHITEISQCGEACINNKDCKAFIVDDDVKNCVLVDDYYGLDSNNNGWNLYLPKTKYKIVKNVDSEKCEELCETDELCNGYTFNASKKICNIYPERVNPSNLINSNDIYGNKKSDMNLYGIYNIYQNNTCINSTLFDKNPTVSNSMGVIFNNLGIPIIPETLMCADDTNNKFIFTEDGEIKSFVTDTMESNINDTKCIQLNSDNSITNADCVQSENQKWIYDNSFNTLVASNGKCLSLETDNNNIKLSTESCKNDVNQKFYLKSADNILQPVEYNRFESYGNIFSMLNDGGYYLYLIILIILFILVIKR